MKPAPEELKKFCPNVSDRFIQSHLNRLEESYFDYFDSYDIGQHLTLLSDLSRTNPVEIYFPLIRRNQVACTLLAFNYPSVFSLITGVLASIEIDIRSGVVFTYQPAPPANFPLRRLTPRKLKQTTQDPVRRRKIIDHFYGHVVSPQDDDSWLLIFKERILEIFSLLEDRDPASSEKAKQRVNEWVVRKLTRSRRISEPVLYPVDIQIDTSSETKTQVRVISQDTPAFLYALSTAFSLNDLLIEDVRIHTEGNRIEDELSLVHRKGRSLKDPAMARKIRLSILMTKTIYLFFGQVSQPLCGPIPIRTTGGGHRRAPGKL